MSGGRSNANSANQTVVSILIEEDDYNLLHQGPNFVNRSKRQARSQLASLLSLMYAICVGLAGVLLPLSEALQDQWLETHPDGIFAVYVYTVGTAFLIYLQVHLIPKSKQNHINAEKKRMETVKSTIFETAENDEGDNQPTNSPRLNHVSTANLKDRRRLSGARRESLFRISSTSHMDNVLTVSSNVLANDKLASKVWLDAKKLNESFEHEGTSFYLRIGTLVFGLGNMIHTGLEINYHLFQCTTSIYGFTYVFRLVLVFVQTFFILKNSQAHVTVKTRLARFGFMHLIVTNFYVWFRTLVAEVLHQIHLKEHDDHHADDHYGYNDTTTLAAKAQESTCEEYRRLLNNASPYLFPFILEYSLIATGIFAVMSLNVGHVEPSAFLHNLQYLLKKAMAKNKKNTTGAKVNTPQEREQLNAGLDHPAMHREDSKGERLNHCPSGPLHSTVNGGPVSLHNSHRGIFIGFVLLAVIAVSTIVFFYQKDVGKTQTANMNYYVVDIFTHVCLLAASITALVQLNVLPVSVKPLSVDDIILLIAMSGSCFLEFALLLPAIHYLGGDDVEKDKVYANTLLSVFDAFLAIIEGLIQTILIISGLRRYSEEKLYKSDGSGREVMPGREAITFLIVTNVTVWINRSIHVKELELEPMNAFYGDFAWLLIVNFNLPLLLFFRFHSSVCFADIWRTAYIPLTDDLQSSLVQPHKSHHGHHHHNHHISHHSFRLANPRLSIIGLNSGRASTRSVAGVNNEIFEEDEDAERNATNGNDSEDTIHQIDEAQESSNHLTVPKAESYQSQVSQTSVDTTRHVKFTLGGKEVVVEAPEEDQSET